MRYIFVDEAGTSAHEPVTVVVGIIADADRHVMGAEALVSETLGAVPPQHKSGFIFHATQVFGDRKYQLDWSMGDRLNLLKNMMSIPRRLGMGITISAQWRNAPDHTEFATQQKMSSSQLQHLRAFRLCLGVTDRNIRRHARNDEVAAVVAEDIPEMRKFLKDVPRRLRDSPFYFKPEMLRKTTKDIEAGYSLQGGDLRITRIRNSVHFVDKAEDPLVQVADACAYGIRRFFAGESFGNDFADAVMGNHNVLSHFGSPSGCECWWLAR